MKCIQTLYFLIALTFPASSQIPVLIVDGFSNHDWQQTTRVTKWILEKSGRFKVDISTIPADSSERAKWQPRFNKYAVVIQNTNNINNPGLKWPARAERELEQFVERGGGLYILHSGNNAFPHWSEYDKMIGMGWRPKSMGYALEIDADKNIIRYPPGTGRSTGHGTRFNAVIQILNRHPINKDYPGQWQTANTEVYYFPRGLAENLTVLSYAYDSTGTQKMWPVEWVVAYGKGRVYNSTMGHLWKGESYPPAYRCYGFQTTMIRAAEWLATGKVTYQVPGNFPKKDSISLGSEDEFTLSAQRQINKPVNLFRKAGYSQGDIDIKIAMAYYDLFEGPNRVYFEVGDSMGYVSDLKNHDARTEGLSYGMMIAVQLDKKNVFDRIWRWSKKYSQHQEGPREGYFAWSIDPQTGKRNSEGSASDGELYYITSLLFAANRWGNNTGIHYYNEARRILDAMWEKDGTGNIYNLINTAHKQITFVPEGNNYNWTDPSYHLPAFYEVWAMYAKDGHEQFYKDCADTSRVFLHRACHPVTGLNADYTEFSGQPHPAKWMPPAFRFDSWRVPMNIAMDYVWFGKDKSWQEDYARRFQQFLRSKGLFTFEDQFNLDGSPPDFILPAGNIKKLRHSLGLVATSATASLIGKDKKNLDFVHALWNASHEPYDDGYFDAYYDGLLYLFSLMHLSGRYQIIEP